MTLRDYQWSIAQHIIDTPRCAVWASMGMGKSLASLVAIDMLDLLEDVMPVLVVAPLRVAKSTWPSEVKKWPATEHMVCVFVGGTPDQRKAALAKRAHIYTTNFENLPWLVGQLGEAWPFKMVIVDEATRLKSFRLQQGSVRARALAKVAHKKVRRMVLLTGTPAPQGLTDLWGQIWFVDKGDRLGASFRGFEQRWFRSEQVGPNRFAKKLVPLPHAQIEIEYALRDVCLTVKAEDYLDIDEPIHNVIDVPLPMCARAVYDQMEREFFADIGANGVEAVSAAAKSMKCLQICSGALYLEGKTDQWEVIHAEKIHALDSVIEEANGAPVLVAYKFKSDLARLLKAFPQGRALDQKSETIDQWNAGQIPVMFAHPQSAGHGLSLQHGGNILVFFSLDWSLENYLQIIERIGPARQKQSGYDRPVFVHYLVVPESVDGMVLERLQSKKSVQEVLLNAMKQRESK